MTLITVLGGNFSQVCVFNAENGTDCFSVIAFWEVFNPADEIPEGLHKTCGSKSSIGQDCNITGKKITPFSIVLKKLNFSFSCTCTFSFLFFFKNRIKIKTAVFC